MHVLGMCTTAPADNAAGSDLRGHALCDVTGRATSDSACGVWSMQHMLAMAKQCSSKAEHGAGTVTSAKICHSVA